MVEKEHGYIQKVRSVIERRYKYKYIQKKGYWKNDIKSIKQNKVIIFVEQNNKEICLASLCMCVHQLLCKYDYVLQCVTVISKSNQNRKPNMFKPITIE